MSNCANCGHPEYFHEANSCDYDTDAGQCPCAVDMLAADKRIAERLDGA